MDYKKAYKTVTDIEFGPIECPVCHYVFGCDSAYAHHMIKAHGIKLSIKHNSLATYDKADEKKRLGQVPDMPE